MKAPSLLLVSLLTAGTWVTSSSHATIVPFTGSGTSASYPVSATASFSLTAGQVVLDLANTTPYTHDAGQLLTGIRFTLSNAGVPLNSATLASKTGPLRWVNSTGVFNDDPATDLSWMLSATPPANTYQLEFHPDAMNAIIGGAETDGDYSTANGSIKGNAGHNPFAALSAAFRLTHSGISDATQVTNVSFLYNTGLSVSIPGIPGNPPPHVTAVPEPSTIGYALGLLAVAATGRRRTKGSAAPAVLAP